MLFIPILHSQTTGCDIEEDGGGMVLRYEIGENEEYSTSLGFSPALTDRGNNRRLVTMSLRTPTHTDRTIVWLSSIVL